MLLQFLRSLGGRWGRDSKIKDGQGKLGRASRDEARTLIAAGNLRSAIPILQAHLSADPHDVDSLNDLGCCLAHIGDEAAACRVLELALRIDESHLATTLNYAKILADRRKSDEALALIRNACVLRPGHPLVESALSSVAFWRGDPLQARLHAARAWAKLPDDLRLSGTLLFFSAYADIDEALIAAEHRFWAETVAPLAPLGSAVDARLSALSLPPKDNSRVRIGYWSPDLREHSIRYFLRPLLENHDRARFEVVVYHDSPKSDEQTALVSQAVDHFAPVSDLSDDLLRQLFRAHELDVLVELAGHTGNNRVNLLQERHATLQLTGLGYPATTGLSAIDGKILDRHIVDGASPRYYTERPLALDGSFWCFDPLEDIPVEPSPPAERNGFITFACIGNVAKTNPRIYDCWAEILRQVPQAQLHIRSVSFSDPSTVTRVSDELARCGVPIDRVVMQEPVWPPRALLESFKDIDIVLDTFPFNGGTTSAFAIHMGVPVVCWAGDSLLSRMGQSMMRNVEMADWIAQDAAGYVATAIRGATDLAGLRRFRAEVRQRLRASALGNGALYARDFEDACLEVLGDARRPGRKAYAHQVGAIPESMAVERAERAIATGQFAATKRIVDYCLREYPQCGAAHGLRAALLSENGLCPTRAATYLEEAVPGLLPVDQAIALRSAAKYWLLAAMPEEAASALSRAGTPLPSHGREALRHRLLSASAAAFRCAGSTAADGGTPPPYACNEPIDIHIVISCDDDGEFRALAESARSILTVHGQTKQLRVTRCREAQRSQAYRESIADERAKIVIWIQRNISLHNGSLLANIRQALTQCDVLGLTGASRWDSIDWQDCSDSERAGCLVVPAPNEMVGCEVQIHGRPDMGRALQEGMAVLDGSFIAFKRDCLPRECEHWLDPLLEDGGTLLEEVFAHRAYRAGLKLAAHCALGVMWDWRKPLARSHEREARLRAVESLAITVSQEPRDTPDLISAPIFSIVQAVGVQRSLFNPTIVADHHQAPALN